MLLSAFKRVLKKKHTGKKLVKKCRGNYVSKQRLDKQLVLSPQCKMAVGLTDTLGPFCEELAGSP